nr:helicase HerA-like domain-containing protein [Aerococcus sp. 1KP-2016]
MVKLIRSKGVGIYFVTQSPADIPDPVLAQLSNRIQHALRAYTPAEQKAVKTAAESFRPNPSFDTSTVISTLGVGQALVSTLDGEGIPQMVEQTAIILPQSKMAPAAPENIQQAMADDGMSKYDQTVEKDSAYELLQAKQDETQAEAQLSAEREAFEKEKAEYAAAKEKESEAQAKAAEKAQKKAEKAAAEEAKRAERRRAKIESQVISTASQLIKRGILNTLKKHFM